jgi:hypothetical protein
MNITLKPLGRGRFSATLDGRVLAESRTPLFDAARTLSREGVHPETVLTMRHNSSLIISMVTTVGKASRFSVIERDDRGLTFENYHPRPPQDASRTVVEPSRMAIASWPDEFPSETENAFSDDHVLI